MMLNVGVHIPVWSMIMY